MFSLTLRGKITSAVSLLVVTILGTCGFLVLEYFEGQLKRAIARQQFPLVSAMAVELDSKVLAARNELQAVAWEMEPFLDDAGNLQEIIDRRTDSRLIFDNGMYVFTPEGRIIAGKNLTPAHRRLNFSTCEYFARTVAAKKPVISEPFGSIRYPGRPIIMFTQPLLDESGRLKAIVGGSIHLLNDNFLGRISGVTLGKGGYLYLYSQERTMIVHPDRSRILKRDVPPGANQLFDKALEGFEGTGETVTSRGLEKCGLDTCRQHAAGGSLRAGTAGATLPGSRAAYGLRNGRRGHLSLRRLPDRAPRPVDPPCPVHNGP